MDISRYPLSIIHYSLSIINYLLPVSHLVCVMIFLRKHFVRYYVYCLVVAAVAIVVESCQSKDSSALHNPLIQEGQKLAQQHCASCHLLPSPEMLDKRTWVDHTLPAMAPNLGLEAYPGGQYLPGPRPAITLENWQKIIAYYETLAPPALKPASAPVSAQEDWSIFSLQKPNADPTQTVMTTLVAIDTIGHRLFSSDAFRTDLTEWTPQLQPKQTKPLNSNAVNAAFWVDAKGSEKAVFTCLGTMRAVDALKGEVVAVDGSGKTDTTILAANLPRPLQSIPVDLNKDGLMDWVVSGFGHLNGGLYWLKQQPNHRFERMPIRQVAGAVQTVTGDFNADGWPDLMTLFAHANEGIWLFLNDKKGGFTERPLLQFPPVYGSTSFQLVDLNKDGKLDILYTCGDNSDYSKVLKPYHGLYIFLNQSDLRYKQAYFYPINGCTKAIASDFDQDGDMDIATIAFFADFQHKPTENFQYFEQQKPLDFLPHALPITAYGRWICMDVNDIDQDGDADIVLGNFSKTFIIQEGFTPTWDTHLPLIVLKNKTH